MLVFGPNGEHYCSFPSLCACTNTEKEEEVVLLVTYEQSQTHCTQPITVPPSAKSESGRGGLRNHRPQSYTCTGVRAIRFLGAYSRLLASSARPALIKFLVTGAVRGIALRTSACIDCVRLQRTYTRDVSCEWIH
jgi:hypothetical protein